MRGEETISRRNESFMKMPEHDYENDEEELLLLEKSLHDHGFDMGLHDEIDNRSNNNNNNIIISKRFCFDDESTKSSTIYDEGTIASEGLGRRVRSSEEEQAVPRVSSFSLPPSKSALKRRNTIDRVPSPAQLKRVSFANLEVRQYPIILGDHPDCSNGPPVTIGWEYEHCGNIDVTAYESIRRKRRSSYDLGIPLRVRDRILRTSSGHTDKELRNAIAEVRRVRRQRIRTRNRLYLSHVEEKVQSMGRKLGKMFGRRKESLATKAIAPVNKEQGT